MMGDLRDWLRRHNFEQYADAFEANDIGLDILPDLSERDLEQHEVVVVGRPSGLFTEHLDRVVKRVQSIVQSAEGGLELKRLVLCNARGGVRSQ